MRRVAAYVLTTGLVIGFLYQRDLASQINTVKELAPGVYFHEGDLRAKGHCNNGWVVFDDYVLVLDANFPSGAQEVLAKIKAQTSKPIRFAFDTHHHGDHAYGNQIWVDNGAVPVAHENVVAEMRKYETGLFGGKPGRWEDEAKQREDLKGTRLKAPSLLYKDLMIFDDGTHRVELRYFGVGHTHGDGFAWLPKEKILFTGDAAVNGPFNYMGDGDSGGVGRHARQGSEARRRRRGAGARALGRRRRARGPAAVLRGAASGGREEEEPGARPRAGRRARHARGPPQAARHLHRHERQRVPITGGAGVQGDDRQGVSEERGAGRRPPRARAPSRHRSDAVGPTSFRPRTPRPVSRRADPGRNRVTAV